MVTFVRDFSDGSFFAMGALLEAWRSAVSSGPALPGRPDGFRRAFRFSRVLPGKRHCLSESVFVDGVETDFCASRASPCPVIPLRSRKISCGLGDDADLCLLEQDGGRMASVPFNTSSCARLTQCYPGIKTTEVFRSILAETTAQT